MLLHTFSYNIAMHAKTCIRILVDMHMAIILFRYRCMSACLGYTYKMYKNSNLRKEVGIAIKSKETSSQFESVRNSYVAIMHQPVTIYSTM